MRKNQLQEPHPNSVANWQHYAHIGSCKWIEIKLADIARSRTASQAARAQANLMLAEAEHLRKLLEAECNLPLPKKACK